MKKICVICILGIVLLSACTTSTVFTEPTASPTPAPVSVELVLTGRLSNISKPPYCGYVFSGAIAEYTDLQVLSGSYPSDTIYVVHGCPEMPRNEYSAESGTLTSFETGDYHLLFLTTENVFKIEMINQAGLEIPPGAIMYYSFHVDLYTK
jgi:hypothetical protein